MKKNVVLVSVILLMLVLWVGVTHAALYGIKVNLKTSGGTLLGSNNVIGGDTYKIEVQLTPVDYNTVGATVGFSMNSEDVLFIPSSVVETDEFARAEVTCVMPRKLGRYQLAVSCTLKETPAGPLSIQFINVVSVLPGEDGGSDGGFDIPFFEMGIPLIALAAVVAVWLIMRRKKHK